MSKKVILGIVAGILALNFAVFGSNVWAEEVDGYVWVESSESTEDGEAVVTSDDIVIEEIDNCLGSSGIPENCITPVEEEPEMWPVYLSFGAIGVTFLLIVIINLTGRKYNRK